MTPSQLAHFRHRLLDELTVLLQTLDRDVHEATVARLFDPDSASDEADDAERTRLEDLQLRLDERSGAVAQAIGDALERMRLGQYGRCVDCGLPIELDRLEIIPWAERCAEHQRRFEEEHRERPATL